MKSKKNERFAALRSYLLTWATTKLRNHGTSDIDDLVQDTIERVLTSDTANMISMSDHELRGFAWVALDRLVKDRLRATKRQSKAAAALVEVQTGYDPGPLREIEVRDYLEHLDAHDQSALVVIAESGGRATRRRLEEAGFTKYDFTRIRRGLKEGLAQ